jgi:transcriptional regulator GlxA family with amidase domain
MGYAGPDDPDNGTVSTTHERRRRAAREIGVVLFDGFSLLTMGVIPEVFQMANEVYASQSRGGTLYNVCFYSGEGGGVVCASAISVWTHPCNTRNVRAFDILFIADGEDAQSAARDERILRWLRQVVPLSDVVKPIGEGQLVMDAITSTGIGNRHGAVDPLPQYANELVRELYVGNDHCEPARTSLMLVKRDLGAAAARDIAGRLSSVGTTALTSLLADASMTTPAEKVRTSARWLKENCERPISVGDAVRVAAMSERNFLRCFKQEMGVTPSEFLLQARLEMTSKLLKETDLPIDKIARRCGWINGDRLAKIFRKRMALTPSEYRMRSRSKVLDDES